MADVSNVLTKNSSSHRPERTNNQISYGVITIEHIYIIQRNRKKDQSVLTIYLLNCEMSIVYILFSLETNLLLKITH